MAAVFTTHTALELATIRPSSSSIKSVPQARLPVDRQSYTVRRSASSSTANSRPVESPPPESALNVQPTWKSPKVNMFRLPVLFYDFIVFGMNDGSYGALLPALEAYYGLSYTLVSLIFLTPFVGYTLAAFVSSPMHMWIGQRGVAYVGPLSRFITYLVMALHPPYPVAVVFLAIAGLGNGLADAAWNAYLGDFKRTNEILGIMHSCYGLGATISPLIITAMIQTYHYPWWYFYYIMVALTLFDLALGVAAFWKESGAEFRRKNVGEEGTSGRNRQAVKEKVTWLIAVFLLFYVGTEVSLGGWIITFMTKVRNGEDFASGITATGFWLGITLGRISLGFITPKIGERLAVTVYLVLVLGLQLIFWLVPSFLVSAIVVAFQGFFMGPLFPAAVVATAKLLPKKLHVSAIGISAAVGGGGAAILPFLTGLIVNSKGVQTLQPIILAFLACQLVVWLVLPRFPKNNHDD